MHMSETGRKPPVFGEAAFIANEIIDSGFEFDAGQMFYTYFKLVTSFLFHLNYCPTFNLENLVKFNHFVP